MLVMVCACGAAMEKKPVPMLTCQGARRAARAGYVLAGMWVAAVSAAAGKPAEIATYHGFKIQLSGFGDEADTQAALTLVREQIDMVERVGLSAAQLGFFRSLKMRISGNLRGYYGIYDKGEISLAPAQIDGHNPTLLHEFMHALHDRKLPGGFSNKEIDAAYKDAFGNKRYEGTNAAYFLTNSHEYFAVTATLYLWGSLPYNRPYARSVIRDSQPDYYKFLGRLFGTR